jgi:hypothetical protein
MPPWPADPSYSHFAGEKFLTDEEIGLISQWVESGAPRGDSSAVPPQPQFYRGSHFRKPDLVVRCVEPVKIRGNGTDVFLMMKFPYVFNRDTVVDFAEFVPDQRKLVHHVNGHLLSYDEHRAFDYFSGEYKSADDRSKLMDIYKRMHIPYTDKLKPEFPMLTANTVYYLPGYEPQSYPNGIGGYRLKKNGLFLINNIHYGPSQADVYDSSHINVFFRKEPISRPVNESQLGTFGITTVEPEFIIPPNEVKTFHTSYTFKNAVSLLSINPHMHLTGKKFLAFAIKPNGDTMPVIRINKWDFRWQYYYTFRRPLVMTPGTTLHVYGTFDNTSNNPNNPFYPPRTITQGNGVESMKTSEEMFQLIFTYMQYRQGDENISLEQRSTGN